MARSPGKFRWTPAGTGFRFAASRSWFRGYTRLARFLRQGKMNPLKRLVLNILLGLNRRIVTRSQTAPTLVTGAFADGTVFGFPFADPYWHRAGLGNADYETEILDFLVRARDIPFDFVDCGANFGYWSTLVTGESLGKHKAVAIEASPVTFRILSANCRMNGDRFRVLNNAVAETDGDVIEFCHTLDHAGSRILDTGIPGSGASSPTDRITTVSLGTVIAEHVEPDRAVFVKLDVEGHEIPSIRGMRNVLNRDILLVYEDHGEDPDSHVTGFLLSEGWRVFWPTTGNPDGLRLQPVSSVDDIRACKSNPHLGYNLFALPPRAGSVWDNLL